MIDIEVNNHLQSNCIGSDSFGSSTMVSIALEWGTEQEIGFKALMQAVSKL